MPETRYGHVSTSETEEEKRKRLLPWGLVGILCVLFIVCLILAIIWGTQKDENNNNDDTKGGSTAIDNNSSSVSESICETEICVELAGRIASSSDELSTINAPIIPM